MLQEENIGKGNKISTLLKRSEAASSILFKGGIMSLGNHEANTYFVNAYTI